MESGGVASFRRFCLPALGNSCLLLSLADFWLVPLLSPRFPSSSLAGFDRATSQSPGGRRNLYRVALLSSCVRGGLGRAGHQVTALGV